MDSVRISIGTERGPYTDSLRLIWLIDVYGADQRAQERNADGDDLLYKAARQIIGEKIAGCLDYLADAMRSITSTIDQSAAIQNTYRYKPYGSVLQKNGSRR
jgi:hypothetical protein